VTDKPDTKRWTDKPLVKLGMWALGAAALAFTSGATWIIQHVVANDVTDARQDEKIKAIEDGQSAIIKRLDEIRADVKELRK
jgi:hypothetical protein